MKIKRVIGGVLAASFFPLFAQEEGVKVDYETARYRSLWTSSPFTLKPKRPQEVAEKSPLEDWSLAGVSRFPDGYFVTLINKKKREERIRILPGIKNMEGFKVVEVQQNASDFMKTRVRIDAKGTIGWVTYDPEIIKLQSKSVVTRPSHRSPKTTAPRSNNQRKVTPPAEKVNTNNKPRRPRRRVLPKPAQ